MKSTVIKNKNTYLPLVITGYTLFFFLLISVFFSTTLPWISILSHPNSIKINAVIAMISLTLGALLPVLVGYIIGDHSIKSKSKLSHHFNGMLFGLLAYWFMVLTSVVITIPPHLFPHTNVRLALINLIPSFCVAIVATVIAVMHMRSKQAKLDILEYKPFVLVFAASIIAMPLLSTLNNITTNSVNVFTFAWPFIFAVTGLITYVTTRNLKLSRIQKFAWSAVSISVLFALAFVVNVSRSVFMNYIWNPASDIQVASYWVSYAIAIVGWIVYWTYQVKSLQGAKNSKIQSTYQLISMIIYALTIISASSLLLLEPNNFDAKTIIIPLVFLLLTSSYGIGQKITSKNTGKTISVVSSILVAVLLSFIGFYIVAGVAWLTAVSHT